MEKVKYKYLIGMEFMFNKTQWVVVTKRKYDAYKGNKRMETIQPPTK